MNKDEFNELSIEKQVNHFNSLLRKGYSINKACQDAIGIAKSTLTDRFKAKGYVRIDNQYVKNTDVIIEKHESNIDVKDEIALDKIPKEKEADKLNWACQEKELIELIKMKDKLKDMLDWYEQFYEGVLTINPEPINNGVAITRSFKIDNKILERFLSLCNTNSQYSQKDLLSWCLYIGMNMMEKYNK